MNAWPSSDDWQEEASPRAPMTLRLVLLGGLLGGMVACVALLILLRWPVTGRFLWPVFAVGNQPRLQIGRAHV